MSTWLIGEGLDPGQISYDVAESERKVRRRGKLSDFAVSLYDVVIHDNKKWFGEADIRLDTLVVNGYAQAGSQGDCYKPSTFRFSRVGDGEPLPIDESGLLLFYGKPRHFLDISLTVSRDAKDSNDLASLLANAGQSGEVKNAVGDLYQLATGNPTAAAVTMGLKAATSLTELAYQILQRVTNKTIGLYRATWLQHRDGFGEGRHPAAGPYRTKDLSFWYRVSREQ